MAGTASTRKGCKESLGHYTTAIIAAWLHLELAIMDANV